MCSTKEFELLGIGMNVMVSYYICGSYMKEFYEEARVTNIVKVIELHNEELRIKMDMEMENENLNFIN